MYNRKYYLNIKNDPKRWAKLLERQRDNRRNLKLDPKYFKYISDSGKTYYSKKKLEDPQWFINRMEQCRNTLKKKRIKLIKLLGGKCVRCGFTDIRALQLDHINGGGTKLTKGKYSTIISNYLKNIEECKKEIQILCANCNWIKRHENEECKRKA